MTDAFSEHPEGREPVRTYILIQAGNGAGPLAEKVRAIPGVVAAQDLRGPYDAIALARAAPGLIDEVVAEIGRIPEVTHVIAAPVVEAADDLQIERAPAPVEQVA
jgi:hypothetical protein